MRIALFHTTLPEEGRKPGGVEVAVHRLANALHECGEDVSVFSLTGAPDDAGYTHKQLFSASPQLYRNSLLRLFIVPCLLNNVSFGDYDVLHLHGDDWFFVNRSAPTVRTFHGSALEEARTATSWKRRIAQYGVYPLEHLSAKLATLTAAVGPRTMYLYGCEHMVNNGVDFTLFKPGEKTENPSVLFVGTWEGRKRGEFLYRVFTQIVLNSIPNAELNMVTDVCPESHARVNHIQRPSDDQLATLYRKSWVFAYPSIYEGFGIPYIEAMASGTSVLCSANDGASYVLSSGKYGIISADDDFGKHLRHLLLNADARNELAKQGVERASHFSWARVARDHLKLYHQAIEDISTITPADI